LEAIDQDGSGPVAFVYMVIDARGGGVLF